MKPGPWRRLFLVGGYTALLCVLGCKAHSSNSTLRDDTVTASGSMGVLLARLEVDLLALEQEVDHRLPEGLSLTDPVLNDEQAIAEIRQLTERLRLLSNSEVLAGSTHVLGVVNELDALAQLSGSELSPVERAQVQTVIIRVHALLNSLQGPVSGTGTAAAFCDAAGILVRTSDRIALNHYGNRQVCAQVVAATKNGLICTFGPEAPGPGVWAQVLRIADNRPVDPSDQKVYWTAARGGVPACIAAVAASTPQHVCVESALHLRIMAYAHVDHTYTLKQFPTVARCIDGIDAVASGRPWPGRPSPAAAPTAESNARLVACADRCNRALNSCPNQTNDLFRGCLMTSIGCLEDCRAEP